MTDASPPILDVQQLRKTFAHSRGRRAEKLTAVDGVGFSLQAGQTMAIVGESGAGKSTVGRMVLRLIEPDEGTIHFAGTDVRSLGRRELRRMRARMQMIFQDPYSSLDPKMTIGASVAEPLRFHTSLSSQERTAEAARLLERVGIRPDQVGRFPYELSGGQLQRVAIARALGTKPDLVVCDEPTASLDVSIQAQVINLLLQLQAEQAIAFLFISHNLSLVRNLADHIIVMRDGRVIEAKPADELFEDPTDPYTRQLLAAVPIPDPRARNLLTSDVPATLDARPDYSAAQPVGASSQL